MRILMGLFVFVFWFLIAHSSARADQGTLSDNIRIESAALGYALQYRVYTPANVAEAENLPILFVTDGQWYLSQGRFMRVLNKEIEKGSIKPIIAVFVDNRDPDKLKVNRRNQQFFCNQKYVDFFEDELVPTIEKKYPASRSRDDRVILGVSFGGLNAACFGLMANETFAGIAMQSPANHPVSNLKEMYETEEKLPIKIFLSIGTVNDNTQQGRRFKRILASKGYELLYKEVPHGHTWQNWRPLMDDVLRYFFKSNP